MIAGAQIVQLAQNWIGTPFHPQAAIQGVGCDCYGLIVGVARQAGAHVPDVPAYAADWRYLSRYQTVLKQHLCAYSKVTTHLSAGCIMLFACHGSVVHAGIYCDEQIFIHSKFPDGVAYTPFAGHWRQRLTEIRYIFEYS